MSINIGTINPLAPQAPQRLAGDGVTTANWVDPTQVQNAEGTINIGQGISPQTSIVGTVKVGIQPTADTTVISIRTRTTPLKYSGPGATNSAGPTIINQ